MGYKEESRRKSEDPVLSDMKRRDEGIEIDALFTKGQLKVRAKVGSNVVKEYRRAMERGDVFPPIDVFKDTDGHLWLADGRQRALAAMLIFGRTHIKANVHLGSRSDALKFALAANSKHGHRFTNADRHRCVELVLSEFPDMSDRAIADLCAVSHTFIMKARAKVATTANSVGKPEKSTATGEDRDVEPSQNVSISKRVLPADPAG